MTTACRDCGNPVDFPDPGAVRCTACVARLLTRTTVLNRVGAYHCAQLDEPTDRPAVEVAIAYGMAMALAFPEWAAAALLEEWGVNGEQLGDLIDAMADGMADRFPIVQEVRS